MSLPLTSSFTRGMKSANKPSGYPKNWDDISKAFRKEQRYVCEICKVECCEYPKLTDAHHKNGDKTNCKYENLQCLCKHHHAKEHPHYYVKQQDMHLLQKLWEEQGIPQDKRE